jgi:hypothetical protein
MSPIFFEALLRNGPRPDIILITTMMTYWYPGAFDAIATLKKVFPGVPIVLGGLYATLCPEHADHSGADYRLQAAPRGPSFLVQDLLGLPLTCKPDITRPIPFPSRRFISSSDPTSCLSSPLGLPLSLSLLRLFTAATTLRQEAAW